MQQSEPLRALKSRLPHRTPKSLGWLFILSALLHAGCVLSNKSHYEKTRAVTLADFAGTYKNRPAHESEWSPNTLTSALLPKLPSGITRRDLSAIDRVKVTVLDRKVTLTFLIWGKAFHTVTYEEGKDFRLSNSSVPLHTESGAAATKGRGGEEMEGMVPVLPAAGAVMLRGSLFLNPKGDIVVRTHSTAAMMVFFVAPVVLNEGSDFVFQRVTEAEDRSVGYGGPRSYEPMPQNTHQLQDYILKAMDRSQNIIAIATLKADQQFIVLKNSNARVIEVRLELRGSSPNNAERRPQGNTSSADFPLSTSLPQEERQALIDWLRHKSTSQQVRNVDIYLNGKQVGREKVLDIDSGEDAALAKEVLQHLVKNTFRKHPMHSRPELKITYWD